MAFLQDANNGEKCTGIVPDDSQHTLHPWRFIAPPSMAPCDIPSIHGHKKLVVGRDKVFSFPALVKVIKSFTAKHLCLVY